MINTNKVLGNILGKSIKSDTMSKNKGSYEVTYKYPKKYNGEIQTSTFRDSTAFMYWLKERSPTLEIISHGYKQ